jgi:hypothetical protein
MMVPIKRGWVAIFMVLMGAATFAQQKDSLESINKKRLSRFVLTGGVVYTGTLIGLNQLWYKNSEKQSFQFFNDNAEWMQVDKLGHFYSAFYFSYGTSKALSWCGLSQLKADVWGSLAGFLIMLPIEIMDGHSEAYGASAGDLLANALGAGFYLGQSALWNEVRIIPKFSFHATSYAPLRPETLGNGASELLKDYNGQTYWLSFDMDKFMPFPKWLNLAIGYGANGMVYARNQQNTEAGYSAYRQYYVGLDVDLSAIKTKSKAVKTLLFIAGMVKLPAPTLEFTSKRTTFHGFYF